MDRTDLLESLLQVNLKTVSISELTAEQKNILDQLIDMFIETVQYHVIVSVIVSRNWDKMKAVDDLMTLAEIIGDTDNNDSLNKSKSKTTDEAKQERRVVDLEAASGTMQPNRSAAQSDAGNLNSVGLTDINLPTTSKSYADVSSRVAPAPTSLILPTFNVNRSGEREVGFISYERMKRTRDSVERVRLFTKKGIKVMVLLRGCSGAGKSHLARELVNMSCPGKSYYNYIYSTDNYFSLMNNGKYAFNADLLSDAHEWNRQNVLFAVQDNLTPIIIDNTNTQLWEMRDYAIMAFNGGYDIEIIEPSTVWSFDMKELARRNKHNTPKAKIKEMLSRYESDITPAYLQKALGLQYAESNRPPQLGITEPKNPYLLKTVRSLEKVIPLHGSSASKNEKDKKPAVSLKNISNNNNRSVSSSSSSSNNNNNNDNNNNNNNSNNSNNINGSTAGNNKRKADDKKLSGLRTKKDLEFILPLGNANKGGGKKPRTVVRATNGDDDGQTNETKEAEKVNVTPLSEYSDQLCKISEVVKKFFNVDVNGADSFLDHSSVDQYGNCSIIEQIDGYGGKEVDTAAEKSDDDDFSVLVGTSAPDADKSYMFASSSSSSSPLSMLGDDKHSSEFDQVEDLIRFSDDDQSPIMTNVSGGSLIDSPIQNRLTSGAINSEHEDATSTLIPVKDVNKKKLDFRNVVLGGEKKHVKEDNCSGRSLGYIRNVICNVNDKNRTVQHNNKSTPNVDCCDNMNLAMYLAEDICSKQSVISDDDFKDNISRHSDRDINEFELLCQSSKNAEKVCRSNEDISAMYGERNIFTDQQSKLFKSNINSYMNVTPSPEQQFTDSGESSANCHSTLPSRRSSVDEREHAAIIRNDLKFLLPSSDEADVNKFINNRLDRVHDYEKNAYANKFRNKNSDEQQALSKINFVLGRDQKNESEMTERRLSINAGEVYNGRRKNECSTEQSKELEKWNSSVTVGTSEMSSRAAINEKTLSVDKGDLERQSERDFQELLKEVEKWSSLKTYSEDDLPLDVFESMRSDLQAAVGVERSSVSYSREDLLKIGVNKKEDSDGAGSVKMSANNIVFNNSSCLSGIEGLPVQFWRNPVKLANSVADGGNRTTESPKPIRPNNNDWNRRKQNIDKDDNSSNGSFSSSISTNSNNNNTDNDGIEITSKNKNDFSDWNSVNSCAEASWKIENEKNSNVEIGAPKPIRMNADLNRKKQNNSRDDNNINSNYSSNNSSNNNGMTMLNDNVVNNKNEFSDWNSVSSCTEVDWKMDNEKSHKHHEPSNGNDNNVVPDLDTLCTYLQKSNNVKTRDQAQNTSYKDVDEGAGFLIGRCREINEFHASLSINRINKKLTTNKSTMTDEENSYKRKPSLNHLLTVFPSETAEALYDLFDKCDGNIDWIVEMLCESGQTVLAEQLNLFISLQNKEADDKNVVRNSNKNHNLNSFPSASKANFSADEEAVNKTASANDTVEMNEVGCGREDEAGASVHGNQEEIENTEEQVSEESKNVDLFLDPTIVNQLIDCYGNPTMIDIKGCATIISVPESLAQLLYAYLMENIITQREEAENILNQMTEPKDNEVMTDNAERNDSVRQVRTDSLTSVNEVNQIPDSSNLVNTESRSPDMYKLAVQTLIMTFPSLSPDIILDTFANLQYNYERCKEVLNEYIADMPADGDQETNLESRLSQTDNVQRQEDSFATKVSYRLLIDKFPNLNAEFIYDKFKKNNFNCELTNDVLNKCKERLSKSQSTPLIDDDDNLSDDQKSEYSTVFRTRAFERQDIEVDVEKCREQASYYYSQWKYYTEKIKEELRSNRPEVASYYRELANDQKKAYVKANNEAASLLLSTSQQANTKTFDLHNFKVQEALQGLDLFLDSHIRRLVDKGGLNSRTLLYIIIGRGKRSSDGKSHLKNPIFMRLKKRKLKFIVPPYNAGMLIVTVRKNSLLSTDLKV